MPTHTSTAWTGTQPVLRRPAAIANGMKALKSAFAAFNWTIDAARVYEMPEEVRPISIRLGRGRVEATVTLFSTTGAARDVVLPLALSIADHKTLLKMKDAELNHRLSRMEERACLSDTFKAAAAPGYPNGCWELTGPWLAGITLSLKPKCRFAWGLCGAGNVFRQRNLARTLFAAEIISVAGRTLPRTTLDFSALNVILVDSPNARMPMRLPRL